jgi:hypothetical protein
MAIQIRVSLPLGLALVTFGGGPGPSEEAVRSRPPDGGKTGLESGPCPSGSWTSLRPPLRARGADKVAPTAKRLTQMRRDRRPSKRGEGRGREELRPGREAAPWTSALPRTTKRRAARRALRQEPLSPRIVAQNFQANQSRGRSAQRKPQTADPVPEKAKHSYSTTPSEARRADRDRALEADKTRRQPGSSQDAVCGLEAFEKSVLISETPGPARKGRSRGCPTTRPSSNGVRRAT